MKNILLVLIAILMLGNGKRSPLVDVNYVTKKFKEHANNIEKVEYSIQRIDSFPQNGVVWNNKGVALIEKNGSDKMLGFSFYGKRDDVPTEYIYDKGIGFEISNADKNYKVYKNGFGFLGSPGGQMIVQNIFHLDSVYKSLTLIENEKSFILKYEFRDDTVHNVTNIVKSVELSKDNFFPLKITRTSKVLDRRNFNQVILSNVKINRHVEQSIEKYKDGFKDYSIVQPEKRLPNRLLGKSVPIVSLPGLLQQDKEIKLPIGRPMLIDFWEPWCGACVKSFPLIENLKNKYSSQLEIIGVVSNDKEAAIKLISKKNITFLNLVGNSQLIGEFSVNCWPTYFLVDKNGIIQKEYFGFSEQIEKDIKELVE